MSNITTFIRRRLYNQVTIAKKKFFQLTGEKATINVNYDNIIKHLGLPEGDLEDWEIDHLVPVSYFINGNPKTLEQAFHYSNLRWLLKKENRVKSAKLSPQDEILVFNKQHNEIPMINNCKGV